MIHPFFSWHGVPRACSLLMAAMSKRKQFLLWIVAAGAALGLLAATYRRASARQFATRHLHAGSPKRRRPFLRRKALLHLPCREWLRRPPCTRSRRHPSGQARHGLACHGHLEPLPGMWRQMRGEKPQVNQEEIAHILAYLYQAGTADPGRPGGRPARLRGQRLRPLPRRALQRRHLRPRPCAAAAAGERLAWMRAMWNHAHSMMEPVSKELGAWPQFQGAEMNDLLAYVTGAPPAAIRKTARSAAARSMAGRCSSRSASNAIRCAAKAATSVPNRDPRTTPAHLRAVRRRPVEPCSGDAGACPRGAPAAPTLQGEEITDVLRFLVSLRYFEPSGSPFLGNVFSPSAAAPAATAQGRRHRTGPTSRRRGRLHHGLPGHRAVAPWPGHVHARRGARHRLAHPRAGDIGDLISFLNDPGRTK